MLDIKKIRENPEYYIAETEKKYTTVSLRDVLAVDNERRPLLTEVERLKSERNAQSKRIGELKKKGENADEAQAATRELGNKIDELDKKLKELDYKQTKCSCTFRTSLRVLRKARTVRTTLLKKTARFRLTTTPRMMTSPA